MGRGARCKLHGVCRMLCCCNMLSVVYCVIRCMLLRREETHTAAEVHCIDNALCIGTEEARHKLSHPPAMVAVRLATYNGKQARTAERTKSQTRDDALAALQRCSRIACNAKTHGVPCWLGVRRLDVPAVSLCRMSYGACCSLYVASACLASC